MLILLVDELKDRDCLLLRILRSKARLQALLDPTAEAMDASAAILILRYRLHISTETMQFVAVMMMMVVVACLISSELEETLV